MTQPGLWTVVDARPTVNYSYHVIEVRQTEAFAKWLKSLKNGRAAAKIAQRIVRLVW